MQKSKVQFKIQNFKYEIILWIFILIYIAYFSYFSILRMKTLYASYFDLGIMHQTVYNTFRAIQTADLSRILELTNPFGSDQIKRMAIHNDIFLALLVPFYFIYSGPETLLILQTIVLGLGVWVIYKLALKILADNKYKKLLGLIMAFVYLLYNPMQRANIFDFHSVTLATTFLLCMFYFWLEKKYRISLLFLILSLFTKEQIALTTIFFGIYIFFSKRKSALSVIALSGIWFILSMLVIIPLARGGRHFALDYYSNISLNWNFISKYLLHIDTLRYFIFLLGPVGFFSLFSPFQLLIAIPEICINLFSSNWNMRNIIYHYTSVIQPFIFIAAIYGIKNLILFFQKNYHIKKIIMMISIYLIIISLFFSYLKGPLPYSLEKEVHPFIYPQKEIKDTELWSKTLQDENLKISTTGQLSPFFTSRRYFYTFSANYKLADYVVIRLNEIYDYPEKDTLIPVYDNLKKDSNFKIIYQKDNFEVYKKINKI